MESGRPERVSGLPHLDDEVGVCTADCNEGIGQPACREETDDHEMQMSDSADRSSVALFRWNKQGWRCVVLCFVRRLCTTRGTQPQPARAALMCKCLCTDFCACVCVRVCCTPSQKNC